MATFRVNEQSTQQHTSSLALLKPSLSQTLKPLIFPLERKPKEKKMIFPKPKQRQSLSSSSSSSPALQFHETLTSLQTNCTTFLNNISSTFTTHLNTHLPNFATCSFNSPRTHPFAKIVPINEAQMMSMPINKGSMSLSNEAIEERLAGVPVYALCNSNEEFVLISGAKSGKSLGLFCFDKEDADSLLDQMRLLDPDMRRGSSVVAVALNKVFQLKLSGVSFRLIPEVSQVKHALKEKEKAGKSEEEFPGVPVFESRSLILRSQDKRYRPVFFRKEDLETSLLKASRQQRRLNPVFRQGDIEVANLEGIIKAMKDDSCSTWDDVVFIPPGFDVSTDPSQHHESLTQ